MKKKKPFVYDEKTRREGFRRAEENKLALARSAKRLEEYEKSMAKSGK